MADTSFVFHKEWESMISGLPNKTRLTVYDAIMLYGLSGVVSKLDSIGDYVFSIIKNDIDNDNHRKESIRRKRSEAGKKHKGNQHTNNAIGTNGTSVPKMEQVFQTKWNKCSKTQVNKGVSESGTSVPNKIIEEVPLFPLDKETPPQTPKETNPPIIPQEEEGKKERTKIFKKPTIEEVEAYIKEKGYAIDAEEFWYFYESKGWMIGKNKMKNWKAACTTWLKKQMKTNPTKLYDNNRKDKFKDGFSW